MAAAPPPAADNRGSGAVDDDAAADAATSLQLKLHSSASESSSKSQRIVQLEHQLAQLEQIAQEKHMEVQRLTAEHEEEVDQWKRQVELLQEQVRAAGAIEEKAAKERIREGTLISKEELKEVRADLEMQEKIISVLERENAQLLAERKVHAHRLKDLESGLANTEAKMSIQHSSMPPGAGGHTAPGSLNVSGAADTTAAVSLETATRQLQELRLQLQRSQTVELELRFELDTVKKEKRDAERRAAANDGSKVEAAELEARSLRVQLKRQDEEHHDMVRDMGRKIAWYVDHQAFNRAQEDLIKEQQDTIQQLRLSVLEAESLVTKSGVARTDKDKQIRHLQKQVADLEGVIREKNPNSIAQLIRSCQPPVQHSATFREMETKIKQLTAELQERDTHSAAALDRLRVESDRVRSQYQARLEKLEEEMKVRILNAQTRKVKELEKQLGDARKYYTDKLKEQETMIVMLRRGIHPASSSSSAATHDNHHPGTGPSHAAATTEPASSTKGRRGLSTAASARRGASTYHDVGAQTDLSGVSTPFPSSERVVMATTHNVPSTASPHFANTVIALQQENTLLKQQMEALANSALASVTASPPSTAATSFQYAAALQGQLQQLHNELALSKRLLSEAQEESRVRANANEDRILRLRQEHQREVNLLREEHEGESRRSEERHRAEMKVLMDRTEMLLSQGQGAANLTTLGLASSSPGSKHNHGGHTTSAAVQEYLALVANRLQLLEHRQATKELDAKNEIEEIRRVAHFEISVEKQKAELLLQKKNHEIETFRIELDVLLRDLAHLRGL